MNSASSNTASSNSASSNSVSSNSVSSNCASSNCASSNCASSNSASSNWAAVRQLAVRQLAVRQLAVRQLAVRQLVACLLAACLLAACGAAAEPPASADSPLPAAAAAASMRTPAGFRVEVFASEPEVRQPIGFCIDDRGRLWVAEAYNYPQRGERAGDRILIFEDVDGDGRADRRTVFYDQLNYVTGVEVGFGGAWVMSPPHFYFIPDRDGDDRPDGPPQVLLDGFGNHANAHNLANGFAWGPDGWLYGTHGRTNWSLVGKPGTPAERRVRFDGGVYRYHPVRHEWEPYADGTTNPWGIDWDDYGQGFVCNCVNPHLFHVIQGAHYEPWRNRKSSQHAYQRIDTIADHLHFVGEGNVRDGLGTEQEDAAGGGHAHCGTMVYLGGLWPARYRNTVFLHNLHGRRINNDILSRKGSGYTASHGPDFLTASDPWFMGVTLQYGPDGNVYSLDWSDTGECHSVRNTRRETGRVYKILYEGAREGAAAPRDSAPLDVARLSDEQLVERQLSANDWHVRHARRVLQERAARGDKLDNARAELGRMLDSSRPTPQRLRALWALHAADGLTVERLEGLLEEPDEHLRSWAVTLLCESRGPRPSTMTILRRLAAADPSAAVRLQLACALQRLPARDAWPLAEALASRGEDADDANLPLMIWYGLAPLVANDAERFAQLAVAARIPLLRRHVARRAVEADGAPEPLDRLARLLRDLPLESRDPAESSDAVARDALSGWLAGLEGRRSVAPPPAWKAASARLAASADREVRRLRLQLALRFNDPAAFVELRQRAVSRDAAADERREAIDALAAKHDSLLPPTLLSLLDDPEVRRAALRALAEFDDPQIPSAVLRAFPGLDPPARQDALQTLASRVPWAAALLDAVAEGAIPRSDLGAYTARQIHSLGDPSLTAKLAEQWGEVRPRKAERASQIRRWQQRLTASALAAGDREAGRRVFDKQCGVCHRLFGEGARIGPDITGAQRHNLEYLLENLIDPSAAVSKDYRMEILATTGGRTLTGLVLSETPQAVTIQTVNERVVVPADEVVRRRQSDVSMMPDGMLDKLAFADVRDLFAYLQGQRQAGQRQAGQRQAGDAQ